MSEQHPALQKVTFVSRELIDFVKNLVTGFVDNSCQKSAAALTYMTLFALVPMMTVTYSVFSFIPAFQGVGEQLQEMIFSNFVPESGAEVQGYLSDFSKQAQRLTWFGVVMLVVTSLLMLKNIERTFNAIWGVKQGRRGLSSFLLYWAVLTIGPLLLGAGIVMSTYILSLRMMVAEYDQLGVVPRLLGILPIFTTATAFSLLFIAVPNCKVPFKYAVSGGIVTAVCFELMKYGFGMTVANSSFKLIYGAFAAVPLFLLWINFLWMIVLLGAVFVRTLSEQGYGTRNERYSDVRAVLHCLAVFRKKSLTGGCVNDNDCIKAGLSLVHWQHLRSEMVQHNWVAVTDGGSYVLSRDLNVLTIWDVASLVNMPIDEPVPDCDALKFDDETQVWLMNFLTRRQQVSTFAHDTFSVSLEALFAGAHKKELNTKS
ncbi:MAG: membrane protein [Flavobacteriales bacterium]|jgi:membrane protein